MCVAVRRSLAYVRVQLGRAAGSARVFFLLLSYSSFGGQEFKPCLAENLLPRRRGTEFSTHAPLLVFVSPVATPTNTYMVTLLLGLIITQYSAVDVFKTCVLLYLLYQSEHSIN